jgi:hypothetical protein
MQRRKLTRFFLGFIGSRYGAFEAAIMKFYEIIRKDQEILLDDR